MADKKVHWTQTPAGKKKLAERAKKMHKSGGFKTKRTSSKTPKGGEGGNNEEGLEARIAYAFGYVQAWIDNYSNVSGVPARTIAYRMGQLLQRASRG